MHVPYLRIDTYPPIFLAVLWIRIGFNANSDLAFWMWIRIRIQGAHKFEFSQEKNT
jgi:hypothetical protein